MKWPMFPLEKIADVIGGSTPRRNRPEYWDGDIPWVTPTDLPMPGTEIAEISETKECITLKGLNSCAAKLLPVGTVLYSSRATIGKIGIARIPVATNQGFANLKPKPGVISKYIAYALQYFTDDISSLAGSTTFKEVSRGAFKKFKIPLPASVEQQRIVEILDQGDALRKKRDVADEKAARILPSLFYKMFGDPATNPMEWKKCNLGDVILETQYGTSTKANTNGEGLPVIRMNNIDSDGYLDLTNLKFVALSSKENKKYSLVEGDILFNRTNSRELVGKTGLWRGEMEAVAASYLIRVRVNQEEASPEYIWAYMNCPFIKQMLLNKCRRAIGMANINAKELRNMPLILPKKDKQEAFAKHLENLEQLRRQRKQSTKVIERIFDTLLYRAFTGDLTAKWREAHMNELIAEMEFQAKALGGN